MVAITKSRMNQFHDREWTAYFKKNNTGRLVIDFSGEVELSARERRLIFPSIRAFQKGEGSDGAYLMKTVDAYIQRGGDPEYREAMLWFVREENRHSHYLKQYMDFHRVSGKKRSFLDGMFRRLRKAGGLKCEVTVLVTAEMIALTYYDALANSTESAALKSICAQMLHDELPHIMFQSRTLRKLGQNPADCMIRIGMMEITLLFVWCAFGRVYRAGGYGFCRYWKENMGYLRQSIALATRRGGRGK